MSNIKSVHIEGYIPFDIAQHERAGRWLGTLNGPSFGLRIHYGITMMGPENESKGHTTYYEFHIHGEEAVGGNGLEDLVEALIEGGSIIKSAMAEDIEAGGAWGITIPHQEPVELTEPTGISALFGKGGGGKSATIRVDL